MYLVMQLHLYAKMMKSATENFVKGLLVQMIRNVLMIGSFVTKESVSIPALLEDVLDASSVNADTKSHKVHAIKILIVHELIGPVLVSNV